MFDYPAGAMIGLKIDVLIPRSDLDGDRNGLARFLSTEQGPIHAHGHEVIGRRRDGLTLPLDLALSELHDGSRRLFTGIIRDISERRVAAARAACRSPTPSNGASDRTCMTTSAKS